MGEPDSAYSAFVGRRRSSLRNNVEFNMYDYRVNKGVSLNAVSGHHFTDSSRGVRRVCLEHDLATPGCGC